MDILPAVNTNRARRLFPLYLSPIETFMLADDQPGYPMTFVVQLELANCVDRPAFEAALVDALQRHPLLQSLIIAAKRGLPCWTLAEDVRPAVTWSCDLSPFSADAAAPIDLTQEIGLRVWVRQGTDRTIITLEFHHACTDGTGAYRFIGDLLAGYGIRMAANGQRPEFGEVDATRLRTRKDRAMSLPPSASRFQRTPMALREFWRIVCGRPVPLPSRGADLRGGNVFPGFTCYSFERPRHDRLREAASVQGVALNDLLLRDLFLTLDRWQSERGSKSRRLRIMMPTDLRDTDDYTMPAANMVGYTFLSCRPAEVRQPDTLLRAIRDRTARIKHDRLGMRFVDMIYTASLMRGLVPFFLNRRLCLATAILSNVADPSRRFSARLPRQAGRVVAGNLVLEKITGVPPLRPGTRATFSISQYDRCLTISLRCDPHFFTAGDTAELLQRYVEQLERVAG